MSTFLETVSVEEAIRLLLEIAPPPGTEHVPLSQAPGRVLAEPVVPDVDIPGFDRSTVDGYALRAGDTTGAGDSLPAMLSFAGGVPMGSVVPPALPRDACMYVPTGAFLPEGADGVAMVEYAEREGDLVLVRRPVRPWENVIRRGEDFRRGEVAIPPGQVLRPQEIGVCAAAGAATLAVNRRPVIGIISTGNELVPVREVPAPGEVRDVNTFMLAAGVAGCGGIPLCYGIVPDEREALARALAAGVRECSAVLVSGGSSKDARDHCARAIAETGKVLAHGIAIQPGKPTILGIAGSVPVVGLPGHPASAWIVFYAIVRPMLSRMTGVPLQERTVQATLAAGVPSVKGREDYVRVRIRNGKVFPVFGKSGLLNTLAGSDGFLRIPAMSEGIEAGETVEVHLW